MWMKSLPVAPLVGAWIEIWICLAGIIMVNVAPLVGAWIEIKQKIDLGGIG